MCLLACTFRLFQRKHTFWVFKRTVSMTGGSFYASKPRFWLFSLNRKIVFETFKRSVSMRQFFLTHVPDIRLLSKLLFLL